MTLDSSISAAVSGATTSPVERLVYWIIEREGIRLRREAGEPPPWTDDRVLRTWSFCNVRRADDRVSRWIAANWREPHADDPHLWFAMVVARFINWPPTLEAIGYPLPWDREHFSEVMAALAARGAKLYGDAYMIHADGRFATTAEYQAALVFKPLWHDREFLRPTAGETLARWFSRISERHGLGGGFMAGQVIADLKHAEPLRSAADWDTFAVSGPGSRRGLNRVLGRPVDAKWSEGGWLAAFRRLREAVTPELVAAGIENLDAQDLQNVMCEFDKYERARLGGRPKRRFRPSPDPLP